MSSDEESLYGTMTRRRMLQWSVVGASALAVPETWAAQVARGPRGLLPEPGDEQIITTCNQCFLGCGLVATVRRGRLVQLQGNPEAPTNRGKICPKAHAGIAKLYHPERIGTPLLRIGRRGEGRFRRASWEEATEIVTSSLRRIIDAHGGPSVALWQNTDNERPVIFERFMHALGSPNFFDHPGSISPGLAAGLTTGPVYMVPDYARAGTILIVGANPLGTKELCWSARELLEAKRRGATLITVDPRLSETGMHSSPGLWLPIRPGTDGILLAGFANYLIRNGGYDRDFVERHTFGFERVRAYLEQYTVEAVCRSTGIPKAQFLRAVRAMIGRRTVVDALSGFSFQPEGTHASLMRVILAALLGGIDTPGGLVPLPLPRSPEVHVEPSVPRPSVARVDGGNMGRIPLPVGKRPEHFSFGGIGQSLPQAILEQKPYPLRALFVVYSNPVYSLPRAARMAEALEALDLVVCLDAFPSETAQYADVVLPAATYLESLELNDFFPPFPGVVMRKPVVPPRMQSRTAQDIVIDLAKALGHEEAFPFANYEAFLRKELEAGPLDYETLHTKGFQELGYEIGSRLRDGFLTPSGRIELYSSVLAYTGQAPLPQMARFAQPEPPEGYPLHLVSFRAPAHANSRTAANPYLSAIQSEGALQVNTATGRALGLATGDLARLQSPQGELEVRVELTEGIRPDTVALSHHFGHWAYSKICRGRGAWFNALASAATDPVSYNPTLNTFVRLARA